MSGGVDSSVAALLVAEAIGEQLTAIFVDNGVLRKNEAIQVMGAFGYSSESLVEYCMRRTRGWMIAGGSLEMLKNRIAEHVFDRRFDQRHRRADAAE